MYTVMVTLVLQQVSPSALPAPEYHVIQETELGPVYSNIVPNERRDNGDDTYYPVDKNDYGIVYSNIAPGVSKRSDAYTPLELTEVDKYLEEKYVPLRARLASGYTDYMLLVVFNRSSSTERSVRPRSKSETLPLV